MLSSASAVPSVLTVTFLLAVANVKFGENAMPVSMSRRRVHQLLIGCAHVVTATGIRTRLAMLVCSLNELMCVAESSLLQTM